MPNVRLAEEVEPNPPPEPEYFDEEAPPAVSRFRAFLTHPGLKIGSTVAVTLFALGYLVVKGPFSAPRSPSEREVALAAPPAPAAPTPAPSATPVAVAPPVTAEAAPPPAPANPIDALAAQGVDPTPTGTVTPPKKHKHKPKKPKPTPPT